MSILDNKMLEPAEHNEVYFQDEFGYWHWWDETWAGSYGPYVTFEAAAKACNEYCENNLLGSG